MQSMTFEAKVGSATRVVLKAFCELVKDMRFTELLRYHCQAIRYEEDPRGLIVTFVMQNLDQARDLLPIIMQKWKSLKEPYERETGMKLFNITTRHQ